MAQLQLCGQPTSAERLLNPSPVGLEFLFRAGGSAVCSFQRDASVVEFLTRRTVNKGGDASRSNTQIYFIRVNKVSRASSIAEDGVDFLTKSGPTVSVSVDGDDLDVEATHVFDLDPASLQEADCFSLAYRVAYNVFVAFPRLSDGVTTVAMFMTPKGVDDTPARNVKRFEVLRIVPNVNEEGRVLISTSACFVNPSTVGAPPTALPDMFASVSKRLAFPGDRAFPDANGERGPWVAAGTLVWDGLITDDVQVS